LGVVLRGRRGCFAFRRRHIVQNALAGIAYYDLLVRAHVVINLRAKHDLAG
jgi:hypothetical protein